MSLIQILVLAAIALFALSIAATIVWFIAARLFMKGFMKDTQNFFFEDHHHHER